MIGDGKEWEKFVKALTPWLITMCPSRSTMDFASRLMEYSEARLRLRILRSNIMVFLIFIFQYKF